MYHIQKLYAAEEQSLQEMPSMIEKAKHRSLKNGLLHHLEISKEHKKRLEQVVDFVDDKRTHTGQVQSIEFKQQDCQAMAGLIEEANELLNSEIESDVIDAAIISCVQKMEHYEIAVYSTALAYAEQLHLHKVVLLLKETLNEEYEADDLLTALARASLNKEALPGGVEAEDEGEEGEDDSVITGSKPTHKTGSERTINSPGGRAGTSHRGYPGGESRGH
jgi:ferritin-like metal-binding protein YciE